MSTISRILDFNKEFDNQHKYQEFQTTKSPENKRHFSCMNTRFLELHRKAMGLKNVMRSIRTRQTYLILKAGCFNDRL
ncbi:hypothetical protein M3226_03110 [Neobacillus cucumis]|uniref:hypothetical protein n=1 Tax=Neobacillus cucumis TaxID=1740721 RepID=UPI00203B7C16|nr:hypothetical protein [Neobacillus cucumis]MCM3724686.1 hypothetical protein [Neobacillus cucumis]